jgi:MYXO-CTERM domain-containing protein
MTLSAGLNYNTNATTAPNGDVGTFSGAVLSAIPADVATSPGGALSIRGSVSGSSSQGSADNNGEFVQFSLSTLGFTTIGIKWDGRGTSSGFGQTATPNKILVSTDGINFSQLATYTSFQTGFQTYSFAGTGALDNQATIYVRLQLFGATTGAGNNRIDNFQVSGTAVPTPGSLALLGLGGLVAGRRRR